MAKTVSVKVHSQGGFDAAGNRNEDVLDIWGHPKRYPLVYIKVGGSSILVNGNVLARHIASAVTESGMED